MESWRWWKGGLESSPSEVRRERLEKREPRSCEGEQGRLGEPLDAVLSYKRASVREEGEKRRVEIEKGREESEERRGGRSRERKGDDDDLRVKRSCSRSLLCTFSLHPTPSPSAPPPHLSLHPPVPSFNIPHTAQASSTNTDLGSNLRRKREATVSEREAAHDEEAERE